MRLTRARLEVLICILGLVAIGVAVFGSSLNFEFLTWDDDLNISANPLVLGSQWLKIWSQAYYGFYIPLTYSLWTLLAQFSSAPDPGAYHGANVALHILNSGLVLALLRHMRFSIAAAVAGACLFLIHPLQVEPVCWASGLRDILSATFALLALLFYFRGGKGAWSSLVCFIFACLAKPSAAVLPLAVLVLDYYRAGGFKAARALWLWFGIAAAVSLLAAFTQHGLGAESAASFATRPLIALDALGFYAGKLVWPFSLNVDYGRTPAVAAEFSVYASSAAILAGVLVAAWITGTLIFCALTAVLLLPVLGFFPFAFQYISTVADHYMYLPMLGAAFAAAAVMERSRIFKYAIWAMITVLAMVSLERTSVWRNNEVFYPEILHNNPRSFQALTALGEMDQKHGDHVNALELFKKALEISPVNGTAQVGLAKSLLQTARFEDAIRFLEPVLREAKVNPVNREYYGQLYYCLGIAFSKTDKKVDALKALCTAKALLPGDRVISAALVEARGLARDPDLNCEEHLSEER